MIYFVPTPIGNLEDITLRAIRVLKEADIIFCEDTRTSKKLLDFYNISKKLSSYHKFNEKSKVEEIINLSLDDKNIAIISDAGMPAISDPGNILVQSLIENNIDYTVLPGPSAFTTALVLSGFDNSRFSFSGFFPTKNSDIDREIEKIIKNSDTQIYYESPHRIMKTLESLSLKIPEKKVAVIREISKVHEDVKIFKAKDYQDVEIVEKGEIVLLIDSFEQSIEIDDGFIKQKLELEISNGDSKKTAVKKISKEYNISKNRVYEISLTID